MTVRGGEVGVDEDEEDVGELGEEAGEGGHGGVWGRIRAIGGGALKGGWRTEGQARSYVNEQSRSVGGGFGCSSTPATTVASLRPGRQQAPMTVWSKSRRKDPRQLPRYAP